jgi:methylmalonyl-CoA/ethylmalonyl-CoA epimerase
VRELRFALTVDDFDAALAFYRDALGLPQVADWSSRDGRVVVLEAGRATIELLDEPQAALVDDIEVGRRVAGRVRLASRSTTPRRPRRCSRLQARSASAGPSRRRGAI